MRLIAIALKNVRRAPLRALLTVLSVAISLVAVLMLRSVSAGYTERITQTPNNRVVSRHKVGWSQAMPVHYTGEVRKIEGVKTAMGARFPVLKHPAPDKKWFQSLAVDARPFIDMHYELDLSDEQKHAFTSDRNSVLISVQLADEFGWRLGDRVQLKSAAFAGLFQFNVAGVYRSTRHGFAERTVFCHYDYFNEKLPELEQDKIELISAEIYDPAQGARIAKAIDIRFDERDNQTYTMEDKAMNASFVGMFGAILEAIDVVSLMILGIILLIVGNTMAMGVRERTAEYGVLRALGFGSDHLFLCVMAEAAALGLAGGILGLILAYPVVLGPVSRYMTENMDFAPLFVPTGSALGALLSGALLGAAAATLPALKAIKLEVTESLRHVG